MMNEQAIECVLSKLATGSDGSYTVGKPLAYKALGVCPMHISVDSDVEYLTYEEALERKTVTVIELDHGGSVPELRLENKGDEQVLVIDGEQLVGAKQNRVVNTTMLIAAHSKIVIPVSCVEQGRWHFEGSRRMSGSPVNLYAKTRAMKSRQVACNLQSNHRYEADQGEIWHDISSRLQRDEVNSSTSAMNDHFHLRMDTLDEYYQHLALDGFEGDRSTLAGAVFTLSGKILGMDVFDRASTFNKQWRKLLNSYAIEAMTSDGEGYVDSDDVRRFLQSVRGSQMEVFDPPGLGDDVRITGENSVGSALVVDETVLHLYAFEVENGESRGREGESRQTTRMSNYSDRVRRRRR